jgi:hypothetical protein
MEGSLVEVHVKWKCGEKKLFRVTKIEVSLTVSSDIEDLDDSGSIAACWLYK